MLLFFILVVTIEAKCGIWYQFSHTREGPFRDNRYGYPAGYYHGDTQWAAGYESLDQFVICNDMEMFHQCNRAQTILDLFNTMNRLPIINIGCSEHIICAPNLPAGNGKYYCQNMDSYDLCVHAQSLVSNLNQTSQYPIRCVYSDMLSDNIQVIDYRQAAPTTTTTVSTVFTNTSLTTAPNTTVPDTGSTLKYTTGIMFILMLLLLIS